jgi:hypothetical protein
MHKLVGYFIFLFNLIYLIGNNTSVIDQSWFWPTLSISLALVISIPSVLIILLYLYLNKHKSNDDSDVSSSHSTSSTTVQQQTQHSRHIPGCRSPPPPYPTSEQQEHLFMTSSHPPSYESHIHENPTNSTPAVLDLSTTLTSQSIQTFQA